MPTESKTSTRRTVARQRELDALELRKAGATYSQIGDQLGITEQGAYAAVVRSLKRIVEQTSEEAAAVRTLEIERLDRLFLAAYRQAKEGHLGAIDRCVRLMERRAKLLGLDAPVKQDVTSGGEPVRIVVKVEPE